MVTEIITLTDNDESLVNVVRASGAGDGLDRPIITLRDNASIALYGERVAATSFAGAVDAADLQAKAQAWLDERSAPQQQLQIRMLPENDEDIDVDIGTKIRVADPRSGAVIIATTLEYEWADGAVEAWLGRTAPNLIDIVTNATAPDREAEALGLPSPRGLRVQRLQPGVLVLVNPFGQRTRAQGVEVHAATAPNFDADRSTLRARASATRFELTNLTPSTRYYIKARSYDVRGEVGEFGEEVSIVAGGADIPTDVQEQIDANTATAAVVDANSDVWDRAQAIQADLTLLTSSLAGVIARVQLATDVRDDLLVGVQAAAGVTDIESVLNGAVDVVGQYNAIVELDGNINGVVANLNDDPNSPDQYTAIAQNAQGISLTAAEFTPFDFDAGGGDVLGDGNGNTITSAQNLGADTLGVVGSYARLEVQSDQITQTVTRLGDPRDPAGINTAFSRITQTADEVRTVVTNLNADANVSEYSSISQNAASITSTVGRVDNVESTLNGDPQAATQYSAIKQTADEIDSVVANLNGPAATNEYSSISQNATSITTTVARIDNAEAVLNGGAQAVGQYSSIKQTADEIDSVVANLNGDAATNEYSAITQNANQIVSEVARVETNLNGDASASVYSSITQNAGEIASVVTTLNSDNEAAGQFSAITQTVGEINSVVAKLDGNPDDAGQFSAITQNASSITSTVARVDDVEATLNDGAQATGQYSSIKQTADEIDSVVADLNGNASTSAFTSIAQNAGGISLVAAEFEPFAFDAGSGDTFVDGNGNEIVSPQLLGDETLGVVGAYARIDIEADRISNTVSLLGNPNNPDATPGSVYSRINQTLSEIDLRVREDEIVSSINVSTEGIRISADKIQLNGDVAVTGDVAITSSAGGAHGFEVRDFNDNLKTKLGNITGLDGVPTAQFGGSVFGLWGELGTGIYIKGAPKVVAAGIIKDSVSYPSATLSAGDTHTGTVSSLSLSNAPASYTVEVGRALLIIGAMLENPGTPAFLASRRIYFSFGALYNGGASSRNSAITNPFPGGETYTNFGAAVVSDAIAVIAASPAATTRAFTLQYIMLDIPA